MKHSDLIKLFATIGDLFTPQQSHFTGTEEFVCLLYGSVTTTVNEARYKLFGSGVSEQSLPPTQDALNLHIMRATYQTAIWRRTLVCEPEIPNPNGHGWQTEDGKLAVTWFTKPIAPPELLKTIYCKCVKTLCAGNCSCKNSKMACTDLCKCGEGCMNQSKQQDEVEDEDES